MLLKTSEEKITFDLSSTLGRWTILLVSLALIGIVDYIDFLTGPEIKMSVFFLVPIYLTTWNLGFRSGVFLSVLSAFSVLIDPYFFPQYFPRKVFILWDLLGVLIFYVSFSYVLSRLKDELTHAREQARKDSLTGLLNASSFFENAERERLRSLRTGRPYAVCFMDLDNFKNVNDTMGHQVGSELLRMMADELIKHLRKTDLIARLGGDEFAVFFPDTEPKVAGVLSSKLRETLGQSFKKRGRDVTLSMGLVTYRKVIHTVQESLHIADQLMYKAKRAGKNRIFARDIEPAGGRISHKDERKPYAG